MVEQKTNLNWRVVDVVTAAVLGIACGIIFLIWNVTGGAGIRSAIDALLPGTKGLLTGTWFIGGIVGGLVIRKPGAALSVELLAAIISMLFGSAWGMGAVYSGLAQGIGTELVFLFLGYRSFTLASAALAGVGAALGKWVLFLTLDAGYEKGILYQVIYVSTMTLSGAILAGVAGYFLVKAVAKTGALDRFAVGREARARV